MITFLHNLTHTTSAAVAKILGHAQRREALTGKTAHGPPTDSIGLPQLTFLEWAARSG